MANFWEAISSMAPLTPRVRTWPSHGAGLSGTSRAASASPLEKGRQARCVPESALAALALLLPIAQQRLNAGFTACPVKR
jgi:hypothetical protein